MEPKANLERTVQEVSLTTPVLVAGGIGILISLIWVGALIAKHKGYQTIPRFFKVGTLVLFVCSVGLVLAAPYAKVITVTVIEKLSSSGD